MSDAVFWIIVTRGMKRVPHVPWKWRLLAAATLCASHPGIANTTATAATPSAVSGADASTAAQEWMSRGRDAYRQKEFRQAAAAYGEAYRLDPSLLSALYNRAYACRKAGDLALAEVLYRHVLVRSPDDLDALFGWAETLRLLDRKAEAFAAFASYGDKENRADKTKYKTYAQEQAQTLRPVRQDSTEGSSQQVKALLAEARSAYSEKRFSVAAERYEAAFQLDPAAHQALYRAALAWRKAAVFERAKSNYARYLTHRPENVDAIYGYAETLRLVGDSAGALEHFSRYASLEQRPSELKFVKRAKMWVARFVQEGAMSAPPDAPEPGKFSSTAADVAQPAREDALLTAAAQDAFPPLFEPPKSDAVLLVETAPLELASPHQGRALWVRKHLKEADALWTAREYGASAARYEVVSEQSERGDAAWLAAMEGQLRSHYAAKSWVEARRVERELESNPAYEGVLLRWRGPVAEERDAAIRALVDEGMLRLRTAMKAEDYDAASGWAAHVLALDSKQLEALLLRGAADAARNATEEATKAFVRAAYLFPQACRPEWAMARLAEVQGQKNQARKHYQRYLELDCEDREPALAERAATLLAQPEE